MELGVFNHQNYSLQPRVNFKRKLKEDEKPKYEADINKAFDYLGIKNRALIIHGSVYPDTKNNAKNVHNDSLMIKNHYIGTPYRQREFNKIAKMHGFNCIQLGPNGELCRGDNSPYRASIYAKNPLFIDYGEMITDDYANILSKKEIDEINTEPKSSNKNYEMSDFDEAKEISKILKQITDGTEEFDVFDGDIIESISNHTLGKENLCDLGKIVYCADKIEPGRPQSTEEYRKNLFSKSLNEMTAIVVRENMEYLEKKGKKIAPQSKLFLESL